MEHLLGRCWLNRITEESAWSGTWVEARGHNWNSTKSKYRSGRRGASFSCYCVCIYIRRVWGIFTPCALSHLLFLADWCFSISQLSVVVSEFYHCASHTVLQQTPYLFKAQVKMGCMSCLLEQTDLWCKMCVPCNVLNKKISLKETFLFSSCEQLVVRLQLFFMFLIKIVNFHLHCLTQI